MDKKQVYFYMIIFLGLQQLSSVEYFTMFISIVSDKPYKWVVALFLEGE